MSLNQSTPLLRDEQLTVRQLLAAAGSSSVTGSIRLGKSSGGVVGPVSIIAEMSVEALPSLVDDKTVIVTLQDSADNSSFANIAGLGTLTLTGAGGAGAAAASLEVALPPATRNYIRASAAALAAGGSNVTKYFTLRLKQRNPQ